MGCSVSCCARAGGEVKVLPSLDHAGGGESFRNLAVWKKKSAKSRIHDREPAWTVDDAEDEEAMIYTGRGKSAWLSLDDSDVDSDSDEEVVAPAFDPATRRRIAPKPAGVTDGPQRGGLLLEPLMDPKLGGRSAPLNGPPSGGRVLLPGIMSHDQPAPKRITPSSSLNARWQPGHQDGDTLEGQQTDFTPAETKHEATELRKRGVTVRWLLKFLEEIKSEFPGDQEFTTYDLVDCVIVPFGIEHGGIPFALTPGVEARTAECYVSHSWELPFRDLVSSIKRHIGSKSAGTAVWLDIFAVPPSCLSKTPSRDLPLVSAARLEVVSMLETTLVIMDKQADVLKQSACQLEAYTAANRRSLYVAPYLLGRNCAKSISSALKAVDIEQSLALCKAAHKIALQQAGDPGQFNKELKQHILDALPGMVSLATLRGSSSSNKNLGKNLATEVAGLAGLILRAHGRLEPAAELLTQALNWLEEQHSSLSTKLGPTVNTLAMTRRDLGDLQSAEILYQQAVEIAVESSGSTSDQTVRALLNLAETRKARGAHKSSAESYRQILKATKGSGLSRRLPATLGLAEELRAMHDVPGAAEVLEQGLADVERQAIRDNTSSAALVEMLKAMGLHHKALSDDEASREYYDRAVVAQRKLLKTPDVRDNTSKLRDAKLELANILNSLAAITRQNNSNLKRAQEIYEEALALRKEMLSKDHPSILSSLLHVASIQKRRDIYEEAEETYRQALELMKEVQGNMHADVASLLSNMADCVREQPEKLDQAEDLYSQALRIRVKALGPEHPDTEKLRNQISKLSQRRGSGKFTGSRGFQRSESVAWTPDSDKNLEVLPSNSGRMAAIKAGSKIWGKKAAASVQQVSGTSFSAAKRGATSVSTRSANLVSGFSFKSKKRQQRRSATEHVF